jgi:hypothetical protein
LEPPPSTVLLSAEEAKERLREIVEGFFFRRLRSEDDKRISRLLVKSPPGLERGHALGDPLSGGAGPAKTAAGCSLATSTRPAFQLRPPSSSRVTSSL